MMSDPDMNQAKICPTNDSGVSISTTTHQDSPHSSQLPTKQITILKRPENRSDLLKEDENKAESNCNAAAATSMDEYCKLPSATVVLDGAKVSQTESESRNNHILDCNTMADCDAKHKFVTTVDEPNKLGKSANEISNFASENANTASSMESSSTQKDRFNIGTATSTNHPSNAVNEIPEYTDKESSKESQITDKALSSESDSCKSSTDPPMRKLPDLPADLGPLKVRCTSMSQEVLQLLSQKIKEDLVKTKDAKDVARSQQLRELSWKVTDMIALGSSVVKEFETKSAYQMQRDRELKKYKKKNRKWNQPPIEDNDNDRNINDKFHQNDQWRQNRGGRRGRRGNKHYNNRSNCHSASDKSWRMPKFNAKAAEKFANALVKKMISQAMNQFKEEHAKLQIDKEVSMAIGLVNSIIGKSIQSLVIESAMEKNNLSLTEAELLCDMCEENISDEDSFLMNVEESISIKQEPKFDC